MKRSNKPMKRSTNQENQAQKIINLNLKYANSNSKNNKAQSVSTKIFQKTQPTAVGYWQFVKLRQKNE